MKSAIVPIMITYDRLDLLKKTVKSYCEADPKPEIIHVFDDASKNMAEVLQITAELSGCVFHPRKTNLGPDASTPNALKWLFDNDSTCEAAIILDSDTLYDPLWWERVNEFYKRLKIRSDFGCLSIFSSDSTPVVDKESNDWKGFDIKMGIGALGVLVTRATFVSCVLPAINSGKLHGWDSNVGPLLSKQNKKVFVSKVSYIQHSGHSDGAHGSIASTPVFSQNFAGNNRIDTDLYKSNPNKTGQGSVLFANSGGLGDIILSSMLANQLSSIGFNVTWVILKRYKQFAGYISSDGAKVIELMNVSPDVAKWNVGIGGLKKECPGYDYYFNGHPNSVDNYDLANSGNIVEEMYSKFELISGIKLDRKYKNWLRLKSIGNIQKGKKPLLIIAPESNENKAITDTMIQEFIDKYQNTHEIKILTQFRTTNRIHRAYWCFGWGPEIVPHVIRQADLFIGNDSFCAAASLYSDCKKIIYHAGYIKKIKYSIIDNGATDIGESFIDRPTIKTESVILKTSKTKLLSICCSFRRPDMIQNMLKTFYETKSAGTEIFIYLHIDDPKLSEYAKFISKYPHVIGPHRTLQEVFNHVCLETHPGIPYYQVICDDHLYRTKGWDNKLISEFEKQSNGWGFCCGADLINGGDWHKHQHPSAEIWSYKQAKTLGYAYSREFRHQGLDFYTKDLGLAINGLVFVPEVVIEHLWYGGCTKPMDDNIKEKYDESSMKQAATAFENWKNNDKQTAINKIKAAIADERKQNAR